MLNFVENLLENERDPRSGPMNYQDHSLSLSDPDRSLVLSHFLTNFLQNLASCHTTLTKRNKTIDFFKFLNLNKIHYSHGQM
jgi:c-di-AMP phosphodiesterase-like protein